MAADLASITVLIPGQIHERSLRRIAETFKLETLERIDPSLITGDLKVRVRGVAASPAIGGGVVDAAFLDALPNLEIVANFGVGYDGVDAAHAGKTGIMVTNTPDVLTEEVADTTIGLLLNTLREFGKAESYLRAGRWATQGNYPLTKMSLRGRRVGIVGMGRIGKAIARRLEAFSVPIEYHNRRPAGDVAYPYHATLTGLAASVDTLISVLPGGAATEKTFNAAVFAALGRDGVFINIGRGSTVDEPALITALSNGTIAAAGLDVFADEPNVPQALIDLPNTCLLPHLGSASIPTRNAMADLVVDNLIEWFSGRDPLTPVPETAAVKRRD